VTKARVEITPFVQKKLGQRLEMRERTTRGVISRSREVLGNSISIGDLSQKSGNISGTINSNLAV